VVRATASHENLLRLKVNRAGGLRDVAVRGGADHLHGSLVFKPKKWLIIFYIQL
jgi:hypothetical protein